MKDEVFDITEALEQMEGDVDLLHEMIDLFLDNCPHMLVAVEQAVSQGDASALQHAAHTLKGSVSNFAAAKATAASFALEKMGRQQDLAHAPAALALLKQELATLEPALVACKAREAA
jgi:HPt (histidine-containing phosphotransfer) domain-containing protein